MIYALFDSKSVYVCADLRSYNVALMKIETYELI